MENCLFCKIVKGEIPSYKVYEDEQFLAFLDIHPAVEGHTLVIPKEHYRWTYDVPNFGEYWEVSKKVGKKIMKSLNAEWMNFLTHGEIPHAHIHVLPRNTNVDSSSVAPKQMSLSVEEIKKIHQKIIKS